DVDVLLEWARGPSDRLQRRQHLVGAGGGEHFQLAAPRIQRDPRLRIQRSQGRGQARRIGIRRSGEVELHGALAPVSWLTGRVGASWARPRALSLTQVKSGR